MRRCAMAFSSVVRTCSWPISSANACGLYFLAITWYMQELGGGTRCPVKLHASTQDFNLPHEAKSAGRPEASGTMPYDGGRGLSLVPARSGSSFEPWVSAASRVQIICAHLAT